MDRLRSRRRLQSASNDFSQNVKPSDAIATVGLPNFLLTISIQTTSNHYPEGKPIGGGIKPENLPLRSRDSLSLAANSPSTSKFIKAELNQMRPNGIWQKEGIFIFFGFFYLLYLLTFLFRYQLDNLSIGELEKLIILMTCHQLGMTTIIWLLLKNQRLSLQEAFGLQIKEGSSLIPSAISTTIAALIGGWILSFLSAEVIQYLTGEESNPQTVVHYLKQPQSTSQLATLLFIIVIVAPTVEELVFRGFLYSAISQYWGRTTGIVLSSFLFGIMHSNWQSLAGLILFAVLLTILYERHKNILAPILAHSLFNLINVSIILLIYDNG